MSDVGAQDPVRGEALPPRRGRSRHRAPLRIAAAAIVASALVACGDDDGSSSSPVDASDAVDDAGTVAACDAFVAVDEAAFAEDIEAVVAALEDFVAAAPSDVAAAVEPLIPIARTDPEALEESEELAVAEAASDQWAWDNCADTRLDVEAHNFAFTGVPSEVETGRVAVRLTNRSQTGEFHEALVLRKEGDVAGSASDLVLDALDGTVSIDTTFAAFEPFALLGGGLVEPDADDIFVLDLEPGEYLVACMLPVDSPELLEAYFTGEELEGTYHIEQGMYAELTVG